MMTSFYFNFKSNANSQVYGDTKKYFVLLQQGKISRSWRNLSKNLYRCCQASMMKVSGPQMIWFGYNKSSPADIEVDFPNA